MGSTASVVLEKTLGENADSVRHLAKYNEVFSDLATGRADVVLVDEPMAKAYAEKMGGLKVGTKAMHSEEYGFAVKKGNQALLERINEGLEKVRRSGEFNHIRMQWFGEGPATM